MPTQISPLPQGAIANNIYGGYLYPTSFVGPIRPQDTRQGQNYSPAVNTSPVQSTSYSNLTSNQSAPSAPADSQLDQLSKTQRNPAQEAEYQRLLYDTQASKRAEEAARQQQAEIDNLYSGSFDYLNQAEQAVRADYPSALAEAESIYNTNSSTLGNSKQTALQGLDQQKTKATGTYENALADGRRMFQEQQIGNVQRFGGSSSAGQALSEIQSREQARQFGQTNRQYTDVVNQVETQRGNVDREYQTGVLQLEQQKQSSITQANRDFQNKLLQIANNRAQIGQAKAEARLQALQQLRNEVLAIEQQNKQFAQTLELQRQQALLQLGNFGTAAGAGVSNATGAVGGFQPSITSSANPGIGLGTQTSSNQPQFTGAIGRRDEQQYTGAIGSSSLDRFNPASPSYFLRG